MNLRASAIAGLAMLWVAVAAAPCAPAGCNCDDTCGGAWPPCIEMGHGDCFQYLEHRCDAGRSCGTQWWPWLSDCWYSCEWTNYQCLNKACQDVTAYYEGCGN